VVAACSVEQCGGGRAVVSIRSIPTCTRRAGGGRCRQQQKSTYHQRSAIPAPSTATVPDCTRRPPTCWFVQEELTHPGSMQDRRKTDWCGVIQSHTAVFHRLHQQDTRFWISDMSQWERALLDVEGWRSPHAVCQHSSHVLPIPQSAMLIGWHPCRRVLHLWTYVAEI
jgi:hypothetical protein